MLLHFLMVLLLLASSKGFAEEPMPPEQAFRFSARFVDAQTIEARWQIVEGYYLYKDKFRFSLTDGSKPGTPKFPAGLMKDDEIFGRVETFRKDVAILLPVERTANGPVVLKAVSQGCWDKGICYPPQNHEARLDLMSPDSGGATISDTAPAQSGDDRAISALLGKAGLLAVLTSFFGFGLLLAFTPCMFPMIPILSGIIVNHGHAVTHLRAFALSFVYVLGMALTYAGAGVVAGLSGGLLSSALQNAWVLGGFALVFVALSLSMFGFYELQLPSSLQSRLSDSANHRGGSLPGIALMGALSALIVGPCVAPPLAGALLYIARTGDAWLGGAALFVMALGMGLPLMLVGAFSRTLLPKSGPWMTGVNRFFGVLMLATALWLVSPLLPIWLQMLGWTALLILPAIYLHALDPLPPRSSGLQKLGKGIGVILLLAGAATLIGVLGGARNPLQPLGFLRSDNAVGSEATSVPFQRIASTGDLEAKLAAAKAAGQPVMLDFYADWCVSCKEMERFTFTNPQVASRMNRFLLLQADVTANSDADKALLKRFELFGPPGIIFFNARGIERKEPRVVGFMSADDFKQVLDQALN